MRCTTLTTCTFLAAIAGAAALQARLYRPQPMPNIPQPGPTIELRPDQTLIVGDAEPAATDAPSPSAPQAAEGLIPGGIVDEAADIAYIAGDGGTVEAVNLKTGATLFASAAEARPLAVSGGNVYVLAIVTDTKDRTRKFVVRAMSIKGEGKYVFESEPLPLPQWVMDGDVSSFAAAGHITNGKLLIAWAARGRETVSTKILDKEKNLTRVVRQLKLADGEPAGEISAIGCPSVNLKTGAAEPFKEETDRKYGDVISEEDIAPQMLKDRGLTVDYEERPTQWMPAEAMRKGLLYSLTVAGGKTEISCHDPKGGRLLWTHALSTTPGLKPASPVLEPLHTGDEDGEAEGGQMGQMEIEK